MNIPFVLCDVAFVFWSKETWLAGAINEAGRSSGHSTLGVKVWVIVESVGAGLQLGKLCLRWLTDKDMFETKQGSAASSEHEVFSTLYTDRIYNI